MFIVNKLYKTRPCLAHASGRLQFLPLWNKIKNIKCAATLPPNVTIITYNNAPIGYNGKMNGIFEQSLINSGIDNFVILGRNIKKWMNKLKIDLLLNHLPQVDTEYILSSDSSDVVVVGDLLNIVQKFESFDCEMVFNAEKNIWPTDLSKNMIEFEKARAGDYIFAFLNAGLWIGKTDFVKRVIREMFTYKFKTKHTMSEQIYYKFLQFHHPDDIKLDYKCQIFQNINRVDENLIGFVK